MADDSLLATQFQQRQAIVRLSQGEVTTDTFRLPVPSPLKQVPSSVMHKMSDNVVSKLLPGLTPIIHMLPVQHSVNTT